MRWIIALTASTMLFFAPLQIASAADERVYDAVVIDLKQDGSFFSKTIKELGTREAAAFVEVICLAYGMDCSQQIAYAQAALQLYTQLTQHAGEEYWGKVETAKGYEACRIFVNTAYPDWSITGETTFNGALVRNNEFSGLGWYAVVPKRSRGHWFNFQIVIEQVPIGKRGQYNCWKTGVYPFLCKGQNCTWHSNASQAFNGKAIPAIAGAYPNALPIVEYYNPQLQHYFMTINREEQAFLDADTVGWGWKRTGYRFWGWQRREDAPPTAIEVCRFYSPIHNTHFYTFAGFECDLLIDDPGTWTYEFRNKFYLLPGTKPPGHDGPYSACPAGSMAIHRYWNGGVVGSPFGTNHRFVREDNDALLAAMDGWIAEGRRFCVPN